MPSSRSERVVFFAALGLAAVLLVLMVSLIQRYRHGAPPNAHDRARAAHPTAVRAKQPVETSADSTDNASLTSDVQPKTVAKPRAKRHAQGRPMLTLVARRGDCWVEVHLQSSAGKVIYANVLKRGARASFAVDRIWIRFGAPENVDAVLGGLPAAIPAGTVNMVVTPQGIRPST